MCVERIHMYPVFSFILFGDDDGYWGIEGDSNRDNWVQGWDDCANDEVVEFIVVGAEVSIRFELEEGV